MWTLTDIERAVYELPANEQVQLLRMLQERHAITLPRSSHASRSQWVDRLVKLSRELNVGKSSATTGAVLDALREER